MTNGNGNGAAAARLLKVVAATAGIGTATLGLVYFGLRMGANENRIAQTEYLLATEISRAAGIHRDIEQRLEARCTVERDVILTEVRGLSQRLDRLERKLP